MHFIKMFQSRILRTGDSPRVLPLARSSMITSSCSVCGTRFAESRLTHYDVFALCESMNGEHVVRA